MDSRHCRKSGVPFRLQSEMCGFFPIRDGDRLLLGESSGVRDAFVAQPSASRCLSVTPHAVTFLLVIGVIQPPRLSIRIGAIAIILGSLQGFKAEIPTNLVVAIDSPYQATSCRSSTL